MYHLATMHFITDRQTDRQTDTMMTIANHTVELSDIAHNEHKHLT